MAIYFHNVLTNAPGNAHSLDLLIYLIPKSFNKVIIFIIDMQQIRKWSIGSEMELNKYPIFLDLVSADPGRHYNELIGCIYLHSFNSGHTIITTKAALELRHCQPLPEVRRETNIVS